MLASKSVPLTALDSLPLLARNSAHVTSGDLRIQVDTGHDDNNGRSDNNSISIDKGNY